MFNFNIICFLHNLHFIFVKVVRVVVFLNSNASAKAKNRIYELSDTIQTITFYDVMDLAGFDYYERDMQQKTFIS